MHLSSSTGGNAWRITRAASATSAGIEKRLPSAKGASTKVRGSNMYSLEPSRITELVSHGEIRDTEVTSRGESGDIPALLGRSSVPDGPEVFRPIRRSGGFVSRDPVRSQARPCRIRHDRLGRGKAHWIQCRVPDGAPQVLGCGHLLSIDPWQSQWSGRISDRCDREVPSQIESQSYF